MSKEEKKDVNEESKAQDKLCLTLEKTEHIDEALDINLEEVIGYSWRIEDGESVKQLHFKGLTPDCADTAASHQKQSFKLKPDTLYAADFGDSALFFEFHVLNGVPNFTVMSHRAAYENIEGYGIFGC